MTNAKTLQFIRLHADTDVRSLALSADRYPAVDMPFALRQIAGRQTARRKLPSWARIDDIRYPTHVSMEQCSSEQTAAYKAALAHRLCHEHTLNTAGQRPLPNDSAEAPEPTLVDLTGGFGVDLSFFARSIPLCTYVEQQTELCDIARHNFALLGLKNVRIECTDATDFLHRLAFADILYIDPSRRDNFGGRTVAISDCTPDVSKLKDRLIDRCRYVIVKLSPMLDWHQAVAELNRSRDIVRELHIVSVKNECKELLFVLGLSEGNPLRIFCINDDDTFVFSPDSPPLDSQKPLTCNGIGSGDFLYEPNASLMKAGCFGHLSQQFRLAEVASNSHLFVSSDRLDSFPGRRFQIETVSTMNKKALKTCLAGIDSANIAVRNFPLSVAELRKQLRLKEGGARYIFATTDVKNRHLLIVCRKADA